MRNDDKSMNDNRTKKQAEEGDEKGWTTELQKKDKVAGRDEVNGKDTDKRTGRRTSKVSTTLRLTKNKIIVILGQRFLNWHKYLVTRFPLHSKKFRKKRISKRVFTCKYHTMSQLALWSLIQHTCNSW